LLPLSVNPHVVFDRTENEPEEWDPEEDFYDAESDGLTIPQVAGGEDGPDNDLSDLTDTIDAPTVSTAETDVPSDVLQTFWGLVLVLNAAVLIVSLGLLLIVFEGSFTRGGVLVATAVILFGLAARRYRRFRDDDSSTASDSADTTDSDPEPVGSTGERPAETSSGDAAQPQSRTQNDSS
jgi:type IV secretory pathway VirB2 component (pilin)